MLSLKTADLLVGLLSVVVAFFGVTASSEDKVHVCIVGGGIAGGSTAHFLQKLLAENGFARADVSVFEANDYIGGRLKHIEFHGSTLEVGGAAWAHNNHLMMSMAKELGMNITGSQTDEEKLRYSAVWTGTGFAPIYKELITSSEAARTVVREEARFLKDINRNYDEQQQKVFTTLQEFMSWGNMDKYLENSVLSFFEEQGVDSYFIETELVPMTRAIYNQGSEANAFSLLASLDAILSQYSIVEGNSVLVERLFEKSGAKVHLNTKVKSVSRNSAKGTYTVETDTITSTEEFDIVFIAAPLEQTHITFHGIDDMPKTASLDRNYYDWYITVLKATAPNYDQFDPYLTDRVRGKDLPTMIVTTTNSSENAKTPWVMIEPVGKHAKAEEEEEEEGPPLWIIYSDASVEGDIDNYFTGVQGEIYEQYWPYTFPHLQPLQAGGATDDTQPVELDPSGLLFNINAVESLASAMEISAIGARNAAKIAVKKMMRRRGIEGD